MCLNLTVGFGDICTYATRYQTVSFPPPHGYRSCLRRSTAFNAVRLECQHRGSEADAKTEVLFNRHAPKSLPFPVHELMYFSSVFYALQGRRECRM